jgi:type I restriction enzyme S subunit
MKQAELIRFKPYPVYKDSGIDFMGEIPANWTTKRLKFVAGEPIRNGLGEAGAYENPEWPRYVRITDIAGPRELREDTFRSLPPELARQSPFKIGDLLLAAVGATFGKSYLHLRDSGPACFAGYMVRFSPGPMIDSGFAAYWTESAAYWALLRSHVVQATIQNFSAARYKELVVPLPSLEEQRAIAAFLDRETAQIDGLVAKKERLIELLQEQRTALITRAVTHGLGPSPALKHSGVGWLGRIPERWEVKRLGQTIATIMDFRGRTPAKLGMDWGGDIPAISAVNVRDGHLDLSRGVNYGSLALHDRWMAQGPTRSGDVLFTTEAPLGNVALITDDKPHILSQRVVLLRPNAADLLPEYLQRFLSSSAFQQGVELQATGSTAEGVKRRHLMAMAVAVPCMDDQTAIVAFLNRETQRIDTILGSISKALDLLKEFRYALIAAAVTGKIDVREEVA